jgi:hypothetical protein
MIHHPDGYFNAAVHGYSLTRVSLHRPVEVTANFPRDFPACLDDLTAIDMRRYGFKFDPDIQRISNISTT